MIRSIAPIAVSASSKSCSRRISSPVVRSSTSARTALPDVPSGCVPFQRSTSDATFPSVCVSPLWMISAPARWVSCAAFVCSKRASISPFAVATAGSGVSSGAAVVSAAPASAAEKTVSVCPFSSFCSIFTSSSAAAHAGKAKLSAIRIAVKRFIAYHLLPSIVHEKESLCKETNAPAFFFPPTDLFFQKIIG